MIALLARRQYRYRWFPDPWRLDVDVLVPILYLVVVLVLPKLGDPGTFLGLCAVWLTWCGLCVFPSSSFCKKLFIVAVGIGHCALGGPWELLLLPLIVLIVTVVRENTVPRHLVPMQLNWRIPWQFRPELYHRRLPENCPSCSAFGQLAWGAVWVGRCHRGRDLFHCRSCDQYFATQVTDND